MSEFQDALNEAIIRAFEGLGGDPERVSAQTAEYSLSDWITLQSSLATAAGAGSNLMPGAHLVALTADMAFLLNRMAVTVWGIGAIKSCVVTGKLDFANVLDLWTGADIDSLDYRPASRRLHHAVERLMAHEGLWSRLDHMAMEAIDPLILTNEIARVVAHDGLMRKAFIDFASEPADPSPTEALVIERDRDSEALRALTADASRYVTMNVSTDVAGKMVPRLAANVAGKIGAKLATKGMAGFVPLVGAIVGGGLNLWFVQSIAESAKRYYDHALDLDDLPAADAPPAPADLTDSNE